MCEYEELLKSIDRYIRKADDDLADTLAKEGFVSPADTVEGINSLEDAITDTLEQQRNYILQGVEGNDLKAALEDVLPALLDGDISADALAELFEAEFSNIIQKLAEVYLQSVDSELAVEQITARTTDWIKSWSKELGEIMQLGSHDGLERIFSEALENGSSIQEVSENLMDWYGFSRKRARATAITEMLTAHSAAAQEAFRQSPAVEQKQWKHTGAHKSEPRPNHVAMDGVTVGKNERFELLGADGVTYYPEYPRDPVLPASERVNCHCISQPVVSNSILGLTLEERKALQQQAIDEDDGEWEKELDAKNKAKAGIEV